MTFLFIRNNKFLGYHKNSEILSLGLATVQGREVFNNFMHLSSNLMINQCHNITMPKWLLLKTYICLVENLSVMLEAATRSDIFVSFFGQAKLCYFHQGKLREILKKVMCDSV